MNGKDFCDEFMGRLFTWVWVGLAVGLTAFLLVQLVGFWGIFGGYIIYAGIAGARDARKVHRQMKQDYAEPHLCPNPRCNRSFTAYEAAELTAKQYWSRDRREFLHYCPTCHAQVFWAFGGWCPQHPERLTAYPGPGFNNPKPIQWTSDTILAVILGSIPFLAALYWLGIKIISWIQ